jgi:putative nucleotidyltransferase with HDIG domain
VNPLVSDRSEPGSTRLDLPRARLELLSGRLNHQLDLTTFGPAGPDRIEGLIRELQQTYLSTVETLAFLVEAKDAYTAHHLERCRQYAAALAAQIDPDLATEDVQHGYLLHDIGKMGIPEHILTKPRPLSAPEAEIMRTHPTLGVSIVEPMRFLDERAIDVIRFHHERFDGTGYPQGLGGDEIPLAARIFSVVDAFDAMSTDRPYRRALTLDRAVAELIGGSGTQFDPGVVGSFLKIVDELPSFAPGLPA